MEKEGKTCLGIHPGFSLLSGQAASHLRSHHYTHLPERELKEMLLSPSWLCQTVCPITRKELLQSSCEDCSSGWRQSLTLLVRSESSLQQAALCKSQEAVSADFLQTCKLALFCQECWWYSVLFSNLWLYISSCSVPLSLSPFLIKSSDCGVKERQKTMFLWLLILTPQIYCPAKKGSIGLLVFR